MPVKIVRDNLVGTLQGSLKLNALILAAATIVEQEYDLMFGDCSAGMLQRKQSELFQRFGCTGIVRRACCKVKHFH